MKREVNDHSIANVIAIYNCNISSLKDIGQIMDSKELLLVK